MKKVVWIEEKKLKSLLKVHEMMNLSYKPKTG